MQFGKKIIFTIAISLALLLCIVSAKKNLKKNRKSHQVNLVTDRNYFNSEIAHVVRRSPSVDTVTRLGTQRLQAPSNYIYSTNSNTSNSPNIGWLGKTAEVVRKFILFKFRTSYCNAF